MISEQNTFENAGVKSCHEKLRSNLYKSRICRSEKADIALFIQNNNSQKLNIRRLVNNFVFDTENRNLLTLTRYLYTGNPNIRYKRITYFEQFNLAKNKLEF